MTVSDEQSSEASGEAQRREAIDAQIRQVASGMAEVGRQVRELAAAFATSFEPVRAQIQEALASAATVGAQIARNAQAMTEQLGPPLLLFVEGLRQLPPEMRKKLIVLGEHGWYLDPNLALPAVWDLADAFEQGRADEADAALANHLRSRLDEIEAELIKVAPRRAKLVQSALAAHRRGEFNLSIPVLLAQTDGISHDATKGAGGGSLFRDRDGSPLTAAYVRQIAGDEFLSAMLAPLAQKLPINTSEAERKKVQNWTALNRHMVLHGESLDYGTEINSLKAISLLNYVASMLLAEDSEALAMTAALPNGGGRAS